MGIMKIGEKYYVSFKWKGHRIRTVTPATNASDAKRIEKSVKTAFRIGNFAHLEPDCLEVVMRTHENKGWALPPELATPYPEEELTLIKAVKDYLQADPKHRTERNLYAIDRLMEHFGEQYVLANIKVPQIRQYQRDRLKTVEGATVNREVTVLSGIMRFQVEGEALDANPCTMIKRLPENERDPYLSWDDFNRLLDHSWWLKDVITMMYYTGMRFGEVTSLRWEMYKPERRMVVLPPKATKEGKSTKKIKVKPKRVPLRSEVVELLESLRKSEDGKVVKAAGLVFTYQGRYKDHCGTHPGKPMNRSMVRKAWLLAIREAQLEGLQIRDLRHVWKTNAQRSGMDPTIRNAIVGHSSQRSVEDRYIKVSDAELLKAVDEMRFDHGNTELDFVAEA
jgi:integrase